MKLFFDNSFRVPTTRATPHERVRPLAKFAACFIALAFLLPLAGFSQPAATNPPVRLFTEALTRLVEIAEPATNHPPRTFTTSVKILKGDGVPEELAGKEFELAFQAPDHARVSARWEHENFIVCRNQQEVWIDAPARKFGLLGLTNVPLFSTDPQFKEATPLGPLQLPVPVAQILLLPLLTDLESLPDETVAGVNCHVLKARLKPEAVTVLKLPRGTLELWVRESDSFPLQVGWRGEKSAEMRVELENPQFGDAWPAERWKLQPAAGEKIETVARAHLTRFLSVALGMLDNKIPTLGPETGERHVVATSGKGRLEMIDGTRVLFLKGTPEEMGAQHGALLKKEIHDLVDHILYGVGVGSSFEKGAWFFGEVESAQTRLAKFMDDRYLREMDALAGSAGLRPEEVRLANFFPELFHCSGFALYGTATEGGRMYHGRVLDYLRGLGLEQNAVVMIMQPDQGNAWINVGYAGFIGSVTAMNEKHVAIGEMGGRGQGQWDGKPMAELVREVMEKADTLDQAIEIMRKGPRTCAYYYVVSDAKSGRAAGIAATPDKFEVIWPGQSHPLLPHAIPDALLMSAGDRYEELARRVQAGYGKFDAKSARDLMKRPVCMTSNIHCALFEPETLDFWVANADSVNVAASARFTHYNLAELLRPVTAPQ